MSCLENISVHLTPSLFPHSLRGENINFFLKKVDAFASSPPPPPLPTHVAFVVKKRRASDLIISPPLSFLKSANLVGSAPSLLLLLLLFPRLPFLASLPPWENVGKCNFRDTFCGRKGTGLMSPCCCCCFMKGVTAPVLIGRVFLAAPPQIQWRRIIICLFSFRIFKAKRWVAKFRERSSNSLFLPSFSNVDRFRSRSGHINPEDCMQFPPLP